MALIVVYFLLLSTLTLSNLYKGALVLLYFRHRKQTPKPLAEFTTAPLVTVQLPLYNEFPVVERLIRAVCAFDYPRSRMEIQVLDDSTDATSIICRRLVAALKAEGFDIKHLQRTNREGYKAGALAAGTAVASGEYIAIFDADFVPSPNFLRETIAYFTDPKVAVVQAKWSYLNESHSQVTRTQSVFLNAHFVIEHTARHRAGLFFHFNGTAGVWRKAAIADAGGWSGDTLTEDLDLSYRARLRGWEFVFLKDLPVASELPSEIASLKAQQYRWVKGMCQVARQTLPRVWKSRYPLHVKVDATFHLASAASYLTTFITAGLLIPVLFWRGLAVTPWIAGGASLLSLNLLWTLFYFCLAERENGSLRARRCLDILWMLPVGIALSVNGSRAALSGLFGGASPFERTPKRGSPLLPRIYHPVRSPTLIVEASFAGLYLVGALTIPAGEVWVFLPCLLLFGSGFIYLTWLGMKEWAEGRE